MGQLVRRFWSSESGSALVEYGLIVAVVALGLIVVLSHFRNTVGNLTNRTAVSVSRQSSQGYGSGGSDGLQVVGGPVDPPPENPDSGSADSTAAAKPSPLTALWGD